MSQKILEINNIDKSFFGIPVLKDIHFELELGEVHALLGENGAGKSTLMKILSGIHRPDKGTIIVNGNEVNIDSVNMARSLGIEIIHQEIVLVPELTVAQNIFLGREKTSYLGLLNKKLINSTTDKIIKRLKIDLNPNSFVKDLSIAHQQMVEIIKAISFDVKILLMDEPTSSLSDSEVEILFQIINNLKREGISIVYISHRMEELLRITDRITVIRDGTYVGTKKTSETNNEELVQMMVGRSVDKINIKKYVIRDRIILSVNGLSKKGVFEDINFYVRSGEVLGFAGLVGSGRSDVMNAIFGASNYDRGKIILEGRSIRFRNSHAACLNGVALVPEDRKKQGLIFGASVGFNITLACINSLTSRLLINKKRKHEVIAKYIKDLNIKTYSDEVDVKSLSGGNQQKVVLAKWLATKPKVLILDEPTRGIDVGAKYEIYSIINNLASEGLAIIIVSSDLPEIINISDRVCVMRGGRIVKQLDKKEISQENIMKYATGGYKANEKIK